MKALFRRFVALQSPAHEGQISATPVDDPDGVRIGRRSDGAAVVLLPLLGPQAQDGYGVALRYTSYFPRLEATVDAEGEIRRGAFALLVCTEPDTGIQRYFFRVVEALLAEIGLRPTPETFDQAVRQVIGLFRSLSLPGKRSLQGLWAEVLLLVHAADPVAAVAAWHSDGNETFDLVSGNNRLEIKSAVGGLREHDLSLEQLEEGPGGQTVLVSFLLREDPAGPSLEELVEHLLTRITLAPDARLRVEAIMANSLGERWREAAFHRFDVEAALAHMRLYAARDVPCVSRSLPPEVSHVRFRVDLSTVKPLDPGALVAETPTFAAFLPG